MNETVNEAAIDIEKLVHNLKDEISNKIRGLQRLGIVVVGKSGAGKSTLINTVFGDELVETGIGRPVTEKISVTPLEKHNYPLRIYDTPGLELNKAKQEELKNGVLALIKSGVNSADINNAVHCVWYCVNVGGNLDSRIHNEVSATVPNFVCRQHTAV